MEKEKQGYGYIYKTTNLVNGKYYIGQHKHNSQDGTYLGSGVILESAIKKYGRYNFKLEILEECYSLKELNEKEIYYIKKYNAMDDPNSYNIEIGGRIGAVAESTRKKISKANTGERNGMYGVALVFTEETKRKMSLSSRGRKIIHKNDINKRIKEEELEKYLNDGWVLGWSDKTKDTYQKVFQTPKEIRIINKKRIHNKIMTLKHAIKGGIKKGTALGPNKNKGHKWIYKEEVRKTVPFEEIEKWLNEGWILGTPESHKNKMKKACQERERQGRGNHKRKYENNNMGS